MRTSLKASFVVGFNGASHELWRDAEVVFAGNRIEFVGRDFPGHVERTVDYGQALIGPGLIDLDALGNLDSGVLGMDNGDRREMGRLRSEDYLHQGSRESYTPDEEAFKVRYAFTQLIRNGITTALPITSMYYRQWAETYDEFARVAAIAGELGIRTYLGPCYMSGMTYVRRDRALDQFWDEPRGLAGLAQASDIVVFDLQAPHLGPFFDPFKNLLLSGRGTDCRASYIAGRCVMEDFAVPGVDMRSLQDQANSQFRKLMDSHQQRAFGNLPPDRLFHPVFPWASR